MWHSTLCHQHSSWRSLLWLKLGKCCVNPIGDFCIACNTPLNLSLQMATLASADNQCKHFRIRSGLSECQSWSGSKPFWHSGIVPESFFLKKLILKKLADSIKSVKNYPVCKKITLKAPIGTKVVCLSCLLKCLRSLYGKQCGPRSDCSHRSSLFWVHAVSLVSWVMCGTWLYRFLIFAPLLTLLLYLIHQ